MQHCNPIKINMNEMFSTAAGDRESVAPLPDERETSHHLPPAQKIPFK